MAFTEDLPLLFDTDEFAVPGVIKDAAGATVRTINVIFTSALSPLQMLGVQVEAGKPSVLCQTADLDASPKVVVNSHTITIGGTKYRITDRDDKNGIATLQIRQ